MAGMGNSGNHLVGLFKPGYKIWLEKDGGVQGDGFFQLLEHIEQKGTITAAAQAMEMSYRAAWGKIRAAEKQWHISLITTQVGGETGGGARLTPGAIDLLHRFGKFRREVDAEISKLFADNFYD